MRCTIPSLIESQPARPRSFRIFRDVHAAAKFAKKCANADREPEIRVTQYGMFAVNFFGSNPKSKVTLQRARLIMWHGYSFDRRLPVAIS